MIKPHERIICMIYVPMNHRCNQKFLRTLSFLYQKLTSMLNVDVLYSTCTTIHIMPFLSDGDEGEVEMKDVWFSYPSRPNEDVLKVCHLRYDACHFVIKLSNISSEM